MICFQALIQTSVPFLPMFRKAVKVGERQDHLSSCQSNRNPFPHHHGLLCYFTTLESLHQIVLPKQELFLPHSIWMSYHSRLSPVRLSGISNDCLAFPCVFLDSWFLHVNVCRCQMLWSQPETTFITHFTPVMCHSVNVRRIRRLITDWWIVLTNVHLEGK